jgi:tetratricopeptide (TPR) repeat protein
VYGQQQRVFVRSGDQRLHGADSVGPRDQTESCGRYARAYNNGASAYRAKGYFDRAIADRTAAISIDATAGCFICRGATYAAKGDFDHAIADYSEAIRINPNYANAHRPDFRLVVINELGIRFLSPTARGGIDLVRKGAHGHRDGGELVLLQTQKPSQQSKISKT